MTEHLLLNMHKCTHSMSLKETVVKWNTRRYLTPNKVHLFYPSVPENCFMGCQAAGSFPHIFWSCPGLKPIWRQAAFWVAQMTGSLITLTLPMCLLFTPLPEVPAPAQKLAHTLFCMILWAIALNWCSPTVPWTQVIQRMEAIKLMERIHHSILDTMHIFDRKWTSWESYSSYLGNG